MEDTQKEERVYYKLHDDAIAMIRELVQLSIITGTSLVDHMRALVVEPAEDKRFLLPAEEYIEAYNSMILKLNEEAEEKMKAIALAKVKEEDDATG